ncbi:hypothetical protein D918_01621 [Trichuris suis]|nr:hypothetical protein D918_01621 [Trichuris suis]
MSEHVSSDETPPPAESSTTKPVTESKNPVYNPVVSLMERVTGIGVPLDSVAMYRLGWIDKSGAVLVPPNFVEMVEKDPSSVPFATTDPNVIFSLGGLKGVGKTHKEVQEKLECALSAEDEMFIDTEHTQEEETGSVSEKTGSSSTN